MRPDHRAGAPAAGRRAARRRGHRPHRADRHERRRVRADLRGRAAQPAADVGQERAKTPATFQRLIGQLGAERDRADLRRRAAGEPRGAARRLPREVEASAGPAPPAERPARDAVRAGAVAAVCGAEESLACTPTRRPQCSVPRLRRRPVHGRARPARAALAWARRGAGRRAGAAGAPAAGPPPRGARASRATSTRCAPSSRPRACRPSCWTASRSVALLWARFNPTQADLARAAARRRRPEVLGELDAPAERDAARRAARAPARADRALEP